MARKLGGTAVGFMGKAAGSLWLLKLGMDTTEGKKAIESILSKNTVARRIATDAIKEVVAMKAFQVRPACRARETVLLLMTNRNPCYAS